MARIIRIGSDVIAAIALTTSVASGQTWTGPGTDWNTASNWNPATVPNSATAVVNFPDNPVGLVMNFISSVNISSSVSVASVIFNNPDVLYSLTSSANQTLTVGTSITLNGGAVIADTINLANISTGSLLYTSATGLTIANNGSSGSLSVGPNTVIGTPGTGGVVFSGSSTVNFGGSFVSSANSGNFVSGNITKTGPGVLDYNGSGANLGSASNLVLNGGTLELDYSESSPTSKIGTGSGATGGLLLEGGVLTIMPNSSTTFSQGFPGGISVSAGHTDVNTAGTGDLVTISGAISHSLGGTVDFAGGAVSIVTSVGNTNGLLGTGPAFATVFGGSTWAAEVVPGFTVGPFGDYRTNSYGSGENTDVTANSSQSNITTNSLRFNSASALTLTLSGTNTLQSGGVLVTPTNVGGTITGGTLEAPNSGELLFHIYNSGFAVNSNLVSTTGLTKTGPGILNLGGNNTGLTGPINVNRGGLYATTLAAIASASQINFNDDRSSSISGGLQSFTVDIGNSTNGTLPMPIRVSAGSVGDYGTYFSTGQSLNSIITLSGVISTTAVPGSNPISTPIRFTGAGSDSSGFYLSNTANTFTGNISLQQGYLGIAADGSLGDAANVLNLETGDSSNGGLQFLNNGTTLARQIRVSLPTRVVVSGTNSDAISGVISGAGGIYKDGTGTLKITNAANTITGGVNVLSGTLSFGTTGGLPAGQAVTVGAGAIFAPATAAGNTFTTVTLNGGAFRVPAGSGQTYQVNQIVTNAAGGTVDFTGAGADQLQLINAGAAIAIGGNSTWLSPANGTTIVNATTGAIPITIPAGVTLTNGIALATTGGFGFTVSGGGTLFQNSDTTNLLGMTAPITVTQSTFRVTDASDVPFLFGNFGFGAFTLDGGTFSYGGTSSVTNKAIALTPNGGAIQIELPATTLLATGAITGPSGLTKIGPGTLLLGSSSNTFTSLSITAGTVETTNDNTLGAGNMIAVAGAGTLLYAGTTTTARTFNLVYGTLAVSNGNTLTLNGASVIGGFVVGQGAYAVTGGASLSGVTTYASTTILATGAGSFTDFSNGGLLAISGGAAAPVTLTRFTNQGSGLIGFSATSVANVADFQTYGTLNMTPAAVGSNTFTELVNTGTTPLYFNGGSRTFIGTAATATSNGSPTFVAGIDLHGQNAEVAGGLFVNNGFVVDSTNNGTGTATVVADFGALVKGAGYFQNAVITQNGGKFQAGNSPGSAAFGNFVFGPGGVGNYVFAIDDATGVGGPSPDALGHVSGWGLVKSIQQAVGSFASSGNFTWTATPADPLTVAIDTLINPTTVGTDVAGPMADFDPTKAYSWLAAQWAGTYSGPTDAATLNADTAFDTNGFLNPINGTFGWSLSGSSLSLSYTPTPVPEPGSLLLTALAAFGLAVRRRR